MRADWSAPPVVRQRAKISLCASTTSGSCFSASRAFRKRRAALLPWIVRSPRNRKIRAHDSRTNAGRQDATAKSPDRRKGREVFASRVCVSGPHRSLVQFCTPPRRVPLRRERSCRIQGASFRLRSRSPPSANQDATDPVCSSQGSGRVSISYGGGAAEAAPPEPFAAATSYPVPQKALPRSSCFRTGDGTCVHGLPQLLPAQAEVSSSEGRAARPQEARSSPPERRLKK